MFGFVRVLKSTRVIPKQNFLTQRFYINSTSGKSRVGAVESVFVMAFMSIMVLGPAGWLLSNSCDSHRKRP